MNDLIFLYRRIEFSYLKPIFFMIKFHYITIYTFTIKNKKKNKRFNLKVFALIVGRIFHKVAVVLLYHQAFDLGLLLNGVVR